MHACYIYIHIASAALAISCGVQLSMHRGGQWKYMHNMAIAVLFQQLMMECSCAVTVQIHINSENEFTDGK